MELIEGWDVAVRPGGWVRLREEENDDASVYLRYEITGEGKHERLTLKTFIATSAEEGLSGRLWRRVPFTTLETRLAPLIAAHSLSARDRLRAELRKAFRETSEEQPLVDLPEFFERGRSLDDLAQRALGEEQDLPSDTPGKEATSKGPRVERPRDGLTQEFLEQFAAVYRSRALSSTRPAPEIAEASEVPVKTVHRWVMECRARGILPKGRVGRAG